jgi:hypothetical protein
MIGARVAAELEKEQNVRVERVKGGLGELSVSVDGRKVYNSTPLWYPKFRAVLNKVRPALRE